MNVLATLWVMVLAASVLLAGVFYLFDHPEVLAEVLAYVLGNFYFLLFVFFGLYGLYLFVNRLVQQKLNKG